MPLGGRVAARKRHLAPQMALLLYNMLMDSFNDTTPTESPTVAPKSNKKQGGNIVSHYRAVFEKGSDGDFYYKTLERVND